MASPERCDRLPAVPVPDLLHRQAPPDYGSGASIAGVGLVLILGLGLIVLGVVFMLIMRARQPAFFRGETLRKDTPVLVVDEP
jgi:hypothetical protein